MRLKLHPELLAAAVLAVLTSLIAQGVLSGPWQGVAVAAIAGISALVVPSAPTGRRSSELPRCGALHLYLANADPTPCMRPAGHVGDHFGSAGSWPR